MQQTAETQGSPAVPKGTSVQWRGVLAYLALAFGLAWTVEFVALARGVRFTSLTPPTTALLALVMLTPAIAAYIVRRFATREGFATAGLRRGPWRPYLFVWIGVPLLVVAIYAVTVLLGLGRFDPTLSELTARMEEMAQGRPIPQLPPLPVLAAAMFAQSLTLGVIITSVFTFGEEFGWTGYLLVQLLPLGRWRAALIYGALWGLWHAPVIAGGYNYPGHPVLGVLMMCALTTAFALSQTALRLRSDSVWLTSFFHASINIHGLGVFSMLVIGFSPVLGGVTGVVGIVAFGALGAWLLARTPEALAGRSIRG
ncbi:MAG: CPBP family intramembrane glutamic endopeptidase [Candidatus Eisenbacteria bacterium]